MIVQVKSKVKMILEGKPKYLQENTEDNIWINSTEVDLHWSLIPKEDEGKLRLIPHFYDGYYEFEYTVNDREELHYLKFKLSELEFKGTPMIESTLYMEEGLILEPYYLYIDLEEQTYRVSF